mgnify:CR=1 FL=1
MFRSSPNCVIHVRAAIFSATRAARSIVWDRHCFTAPESFLVLEPGAALEGWALTCGRAPAQTVGVDRRGDDRLDQDFLPRLDVDATATTLSRHSGWRVSANTQGVSPGEHVLQLAVDIEPGSDIRIVREQRVFVIAQQACRRDRHDATRSQRRGLSWMRWQRARRRCCGNGRQSTAFGSPRIRTNFVTKLRKQEMNTFLTSMLVDLLAPIARQRSLDDVVERGRRHLAAQIESDGLVRYHGLPDGPTIGTLGAVITPDADDTALVWRIAGRGAVDPRLQPMLEELARYRDARGLYRTWLAPQKKYQNLDPGRDPNPTDITIQMHVYLMLHELDPPAAQNLCNAAPTLVCGRGSLDLLRQSSTGALPPQRRTTAAWLRNSAANGAAGAAGCGTGNLE